MKNSFKYELSIPKTQFPDTHEDIRAANDQEQIRNPVPEETSGFPDKPIDIMPEGSIIKSNHFLEHGKYLYKNERNKMKFW